MELPRLVVDVLQGVVTLQPEQKVSWEIVPSSGPFTRQRSHFNMDDTALRCRPILVVKMEYRGLDRHVTNTSTGLKMVHIPRNRGSPGRKFERSAVCDQPV